MSAEGKDAKSPIDGSYLWRYWAKAADGGGYHALPAHLLDVSAVGVAYLRGHPRLRAEWAKSLAMSPEEFEAFVAWWLSLHDIGKFCDRFQGAHEGLFATLWPGRERKRNFPYHTTLGSIALGDGVAQLIAEALAVDHPWGASEWRYVLMTIEPAFTGHHGSPPEAVDVRHGLWDDDGKRAAEAWAIASSLLFPFGRAWRAGADASEITERLRAASWHLAGFAVMCDWIGSNTKWFPATSTARPLDEYWQGALEKASAAIRDVGVLPIAIATPQGMQGTFGKKETPLQEWVETWQPGEGPHLLIIEETTGSGKTEASLLAAHRLMTAGEAGGFYFALPTQATANAMYDRLRQGARGLYEHPDRASLVLAHSGRLAMRDFRERWGAVEAEAPGSGKDGLLACAAWLADSRKKAFLAHAGVGTIDQALLGVLPVRHQCLRLFGLTSHVLIIDEVHAYDSYATLLMETLLRFHTRAGGSTILMTATMPRALRERLAAAFAAETSAESLTLVSDAYPLVTHVGPAGLTREAHVAPRAECARTLGVKFLHDSSRVLGLVREAAAQGQTVCWIRNTVDEAIDAWRQLGTESATLFHARFMESDRNRIERDVMTWAGPRSSLNERRGRILIATQVVEQSLDVDFDVLISDLAPIELILQRAGRLHRHSARERVVREPPVLVVHAPEWSDNPPTDWVRAWSGGTAAVYPDEGRLWLGQQTLRARDTIRIPEHSRALIEHVYDSTAKSRIPQNLLPSTERAENDGLATQSHARLKTLNLDAGYSTRDTKWDDPDHARTRSGKPTVDIHLAMEQGGYLRPLSPAEDGWEGARVRVRVEDAAQAGLLSEEIGPPHGVKHLVRLAPDGAAGWTRINSANGRRFTITYDGRVGFVIKRE